MRTWRKWKLQRPPALFGLRQSVGMGIADLVIMPHVHVRNVHLRHWQFQRWHWPLQSITHTWWDQTGQRCLQATAAVQVVSVALHMHMGGSQASGAVLQDRSWPQDPDHSAHMQRDQLCELLRGLAAAPAGNSERPQGLP